LNPTIYNKPRSRQGSPFATGHKHLSGRACDDMSILPSGLTAKAPVRDITNKRFGRLVALEVIGKSRNKSLIWRCLCDCGAVTERTSSSLSKSKGVCSCGCYLKEFHKERLRHEVPWNKGSTYQNKGDEDVFVSKKAWADAAKRKYGNKCMRCGWDKASCDVHHITPRSRGGKHILLNAEVICPNCHRIHHEIR
jgi:5-methylcytosine-specific restriction endonuclease McrA